MTWESSFRNAAGYFFFLAILALIKFISNAFKAARMPKPCHHGIRGPCRACQEAAEAYRVAAEQNARRVQFGIEWEKLRRAEIKRLSQARLRSSEAYFAMEPREFENAIMKVFRKLEYRVSQTAYVGDGGKDAIAWKGKKKYVIECKRYGNRSATGRRDLQIVLAAKHDVEADGAIFVSTGRLTAPAIAYAKENDIEYYDKDSFPDLINLAYGESEDISTVWTCCLECGRLATVSLVKEGESRGICFGGVIDNAQRLEVAIKTGVGTTHISHELRSTVNHSQLKYPDLDLDAPWCKDHQVPMRRVNGYRGEFWGCPEYPQCKLTGGSAARPQEVVEAEAIARRVENMNVYNTMKESTKEHLRNEIEAELVRHGIQKIITSEQINALIAQRYLRGRT